MKFSTSRSRVGALLASGLLVVTAACGSDSKSSTTTAAPATTAATATTGGSETTAPTTTSGSTLRIAFFAGSSANAYNQATYKGIQQAATEAGNVETEIFDGEFSAEVQFNQIEDVVSSGRFGGYVILPNDPVGIQPAAKEALASGPTATSLFPIGADLDSIEPQLDGMITSAGSISVSAKAAAEATAEFCADIDPCRVVIMIGQLQFPFDKLRLEAMKSVLDQHPNIQIVATGEGQYSQDVSLTAMQDILQSHPDFEVLLSIADQHVTGALIALQDAGVDVKKMWISGGGASTAAVDGMRAGTWDASIGNFPVTEGYLAAKAVIAQARGQAFEQVNDINVLNPLGVPLVTKAVLDAHPTWKAEWDG